MVSFLSLENRMVHRWEKSNSNKKDEDRLGEKCVAEKCTISQVFEVVVIT
jgi:hypothetical protein